MRDEEERTGRGDRLDDSERCRHVAVSLRQTVVLTANENVFFEQVSAFVFDRAPRSTDLPHGRDPQEEIPRQRARCAVVSNEQTALRKTFEHSPVFRFPPLESCP